MKKKLILLAVITVAVVTTITIINVGGVKNDDTITVTKPTVVENENDVEDVQENQLVVVEDTPVVEVEPSKTEKTKSSNTTTSTKATNDTTNTSVTTTTTTTTAEPTVSKTNNSTDDNKITFRVTAYCACSKCCGSYANNRPKDESGNPIVVGAAGTQLVSGVSCASPLPFGTQISLDGYGTVVVQDRTAQWVVNKHGKYIVDIYFSDHETARQFGLQYIEGVIK